MATLQNPTWLLANGYLGILMVILFHALGHHCHCLIRLPRRAARSCGENPPRRLPSHRLPRRFDYRRQYLSPACPRCPERAGLPTMIAINAGIGGYTAAGMRAGFLPRRAGVSSDPRDATLPAPMTGCGCCARVVRKGRAGDRRAAQNGTYPADSAYAQYPWAKATGQGAEES